MQALVKTPPVGSGPHILVVFCPEGKYESVLEFLRANDCQVEERDSIPYNFVFPNRTPGTIMRGLRYRDSLTQDALAKLAGISRRHISEMENGKRPIGKQETRKLAAAFNTDPRMFLFV